MDPAAVQRRVNRLPTGLQAHVHRVVEIARELALCHGVDEEQAALAALAPVAPGLGHGIIHRGD